MEGKKTDRYSQSDGQFILLTVSPCCFLKGRDFFVSPKCRDSESHQHQFTITSQSELTDLRLEIFFSSSLLSDDDDGKMKLKNIWKNTEFQCFFFC